MSCWHSCRSEKVNKENYVICTNLILVQAVCIACIKLRNSSSRTSIDIPLEFFGKNFLAHTLGPTGGPTKDGKETGSKAHQRIARRPD